MLQQTQVVTVISYFERFMKRFPSVRSLALAEQDEVLGLWSGLGYYSRARNLHRCAQDVMTLHGGVFPQTYEALQTLPGIGPSTAAAIASICFSEQVPILDGNVKRVLTRLSAFHLDLSVSSNVKQLWELAHEMLPASKADMPTYTQGIMDLGATVCTPKNPSCEICPVRALCKAKSEGNPLKFPVKTRKLKRTTESWWLICLLDERGQIWLEKRPSTGIWAGLYSVPILGSEEALDALTQRLGAKGLLFKEPITHALTHKELILHWVQTNSFSKRKFQAVVDASQTASGAWFSQEKWCTLGLPAPVRKLLEDVRGEGLVNRGQDA